MFGKKYMIVTALLMLMTAGLAVAVRPGEVRSLNATAGITFENPIDNSTTATIPAPPRLIGGDKDEHGCLIAAGFAWNATSEQCIRSNGDVQLTTGTMLVNISDPNWMQHVTVPISTDIKCVDSDNGKDYFTAGKVFVLGENPKIDGCVRHRFLREWFCNGDEAVSTFTICKKGCKNSACLPENPVVTSTTTTSSSTTTTLTNESTTTTVAPTTSTTVSTSTSTTLAK